MQTPARSGNDSSSATAGVMVIVAYKAKPGREEALLQLTREHVPILRAERLATSRPVSVMRAADGTIVEVFEWASAEAITAAHKNEKVLALWHRYAETCEILNLAALPEAQQMFAGFEPLDLWD